MCAELIIFTADHLFWGKCSADFEFRGTYRFVSFRNLASKIMIHDGEMHVVNQLLKCACVCIVSLQMAEATLKALANDGDSITVGRISITAKKTSTGQTYLMVSQPVKDKKDRRCCWFPNDWMAIRAAIPQVQTLLKSSKRSMLRST